MCYPNGYEVAERRNESVKRPKAVWKVSNGRMVESSVKLKLNNVYGRIYVAEIIIAELCIN